MKTTGQEQGALIAQWIADQKNNRGFIAFCQWVETQRDDQDVSNRVPGHENKESAAQALTVVLEVLCHGKDGERVINRDLKVSMFQSEQSVEQP